MNTRNIFVLFLSVIFSLTAVNGQSKKNNVDIAYEDGYNFFIVNDLGRNGYYKQKDVARVMGEYADNDDVGLEFVAAAGDTHHWGGVESVHDPLWMTNFELIYDHPALRDPWYPILGNHEYQGNTQAVIDYTNISRRWEMPDRYYTVSILPEDEEEAEEFSTAEIFFIDTTPLISSYHLEGNKYKDIHKQDSVKQLRWLEGQLSSSTADFKIVIGHHPIYVSEKKRVDEKDLVEKLDPLLRKYNVDLYSAGHSHTFQHIIKDGSDVNYVVNSSGSLAREPLDGPDTVFSSSDEGFSIVSIGKNRMKMTFINYLGDAIHQFEIVK